VTGDLSRRSFLRLAVAGGAGVVLSAPPGATWAARAGAARTRVYVLVVDGCRPDEVTPPLMPNLAALRATGTWYPQARSLPVMETIPNHVMMMTGLRPDRSGVPANEVYDRTERVVRFLDRPTDLRAPTLLERLRATGRTTGTVLSKEYLFGIFGTRATYRWEPEPVVPVSAHSPDQFTMDALIAMVSGPDPDLVFCNLGDVDRMGHADITGTTVEAARAAALASTDAQVGRFVRLLEDTGRWSSSVLVVLADHSMDWSMPTNVVSLTAGFDADPLLAGNVVAADNGGADLLYWTGPTATQASAVARMRDLALAHPGVLSVAPPATLRLGPEAGDLVAYCRAGWRVTEPAPYSNPIPGNHGHPASEPIPFLVAGGHPSVLMDQTSSAPARTVDVAPTIAALFGLPAPNSGYDGAVRSEAFAG